MPNKVSNEQQDILDAIVEAVLGVDIEGTITFCNEALRRMSGYSTEEIVGRNAHDVFHHSRADGSANPAEECAFLKAVRYRQPTHSLGELFWRKDGSSFPGEIYSRPLSAPGSATCMVVTVKDISEIEMSKEALRRSEEQYRRILENMPDVAWTSDIQGRTRYVSPKIPALLGFSNREIYAGGTRLWQNQIHPQDFGRVNQNFAALLEKGVAFDEEYRIRRKDGTWIWVHDRASRSHEINGVRCADGFVSDVTLRKQAEGDLRSETAFLEAQANSTIDGVLVVDRDGRKLLANE